MIETPNSIDSEKALLGCLIMEPGLINEFSLEPEDFYEVKYQKVFKAITDLMAKDQMMDQTLLTEQLKKNGDYDSIGGINTLSELLIAAPFQKNVKGYAEIIKDNSLKRSLNRIANEIANSCFNKKLSADQILKEAEKKIFDIDQTGNKDCDEPKELRDLMGQVVSEIYQKSIKEDKITGLSTGFNRIDTMLSGLQKSDLIILAARPSMGKTALAVNIAGHLGMTEKKSVLIFSLEMSKEQMTMRLLQSEALVNAGKIRSGKLNEADWEPITHISKELAKAPIKICDKAGISLNELMSISRRENNKKPIDLVIVDYLQLMSIDRKENRQSEISEISRGLKQLARELDCPVLCLSQLSRATEARIDKRPVLSDLRDSGSIEQDADVVMMLYRASYYDETESSYEAELNIAKQRNGPTGTIELGWIPEYTRFTEPEFEKE